MEKCYLEKQCNQLMNQNIALQKELVRIGVVMKKTEEYYENKKVEETDDDEYMNGLLDGMKEAEKISNVCPYCKLHVIESLHHIIPRIFGGGDNIENLIFLCFECHDIIESKTEGILSTGMETTERIKSFIVNNNFPKPHEITKNYNYNKISSVISKNQKYLIVKIPRKYRDLFDTGDVVCVTKNTSA